MNSYQFRIWTRDGRTELSGQLDLPGGAAHRNPVVLMVPGGWFMDRDGYMGGSGTDRDLIYRDLAGDFLAAGFGVIRYDNRGVRCNELSMPPCPAGSNELEISRHYLDACVNSDVRRSVTVQSQLDDVADVWAFAASHPLLDPERILIWAHSEGALNVARLIGAGRLKPRAVQFVGAITESPAAVLRWQMIERYVDRVMNWDEDGDGRVVQSDVRRCFPSDSMFRDVGMQEEMLAAPSGGWTRESLDARFAADYAHLKASAYAKPDDDPYPDPAPELPVVAASNNWWKQWFGDEIALIDHLARYGGQAAFHLGGLDCQLPARRQWNYGMAQINAADFAHPPRLVFHPGRGHSLRTGEPVAGPMDEAAKRQLVLEACEFVVTGPAEAVDAGE